LPEATYFSILPSTAIYFVVEFARPEHRADI